VNTAVLLMAELTAQGIELRARGDRLQFRPVSALTAEWADRVQRHKQELLALLRQATSEPLETTAQREALRFLRVAVPRPDGRGWWDQSAVLDPAIRAAIGPDSLVKRPAHSDGPDPSRPGPLDALTPDQLRRYLAIRPSCTGRPWEQHAQAWQAAVSGRQESSNGVDSSRALRYSEPL